jgi:hypothetical protein
VYAFVRARVVERFRTGADNDMAECHGAGAAGERNQVRQEEVEQWSIRFNNTIDNPDTSPP